MAIRLIQDDERLVYEVEGSRIFYRRLSSLRRARIIRKHTKRGKTDWSAVTQEMLEEIITGWEGVEGPDGPVEFSRDLVTRLPDDVVTDILELSGASSPDEGAEKN